MASKAGRLRPKVIGADMRAGVVMETGRDLDVVAMQGVPCWLLRRTMERTPIHPGGLQLTNRRSADQW
ncbi:MAG: hypothetical protein IPI83_07990 [Sphingomonadales bacterium]|nr:hypothetical protein [Sphingomonadales bacterium]